MNHETGYKVHLFEIEAQETFAPEQLSCGKPPRKEDTNDGTSDLGSEFVKSRPYNNYKNEKKTNS